MGKASRRKSSKRIETQGSAETPPKNLLQDSLQWWLLAVLCLVALLACAQSLSYGFVYDDEVQVLRNPWIRDSSRVGRFFFTDVWRFAREETGNYYRPFHMLVHAAGYALSGLKPFSYHLINILIYCVNTLLLALFGYRLTRDKLASAAGGVLFALHPVHAESVAWIAAATDPLCAIFYFWILHLHLNDDKSTSRKTTFLILLQFMGALFSAISLKEGRVSEAYEHLKKAYQINPRDPAVLQSLATVCIARKDYVQARQWCEAAPDVNPRNEISYNNLAFIFLQQKENDKAIENARKALEVFPNYIDAYLNLARGYGAKGLIPQALEEYSKAKLVNPLL